MCNVSPLSRSCDRSAARCFAVDVHVDVYHSFDVAVGVDVHFDVDVDVVVDDDMDQVVDVDGYGDDDDDVVVDVCVWVGVGALP